MSNLIVFNYPSIAVSLSKWVNPQIPQAKLISAVITFLPGLWLCVCVCVFCMNMCSCECVLCVFLYWSPCLVASTWSPWEQHDWWHHCSSVTSLLDGDSYSWLAVLCVCVCVRVYKCVKKLSGGKTQQQSLLTSMCFILCNKNNYIVFVLGV